jgi:hypothetical protein
MNLTNTQIQLAEQLLLTVIKRENVVEYNELGQRINPPIFWRQVGKEVGEISKLCKKLGLPLLSAKVINKGRGTAGAGFYPLYSLLGLDTEGKSEKELFSQELKKIRECKEWYKLADYLGLDLNLPRPLDGAPLVDESVSYEKEQEALDANTRLSCCAYFLSKFDVQAVAFLGFTTRDEAMVGISKILGKENNYLKRRRDEFDVFTGSHRKGQRNRKPSPVVEKLHHQLKAFTFSELAEIVKQLLATDDKAKTSLISDNDKEIIAASFIESEIEEFINQKDTSAKRVKKQREVLERVCNTAIPDSLKKLYSYRCQICGLGAEDTYGYRIVEAHHILPFSESMNNDASNIIILCPNHHRLIHKAKPIFDRKIKAFMYSDGHSDELKYNFHL